MSSNDTKYPTDALTFTISPEQALEKFNTWAKRDQGLKWLLSPRSVRVGAAYCPVWSFDVNVRFVVNINGRRRLDWKPPFLKVYSSQAAVHLPGLSSYAGYSYRRSLVNPVHNTTLVFLGDQTMRFAPWMLRDMEFNGEKLSVYPDPWNTTRSRALAMLKEELQSLATNGAAEDNLSDPVTVQLQVVSSRRVYMPTYVINYQIFGVSYRAFVSGCDGGASVSGVSHVAVDYNPRDLAEGLQSSASVALKILPHIFQNRQLASILAIALQLLIGLTARVLFRIPIIGILGGAFVGFRKIIQPWMGERLASAQWERQREHDAISQEPHVDDFEDGGDAERFFWTNRRQILSYLGQGDHEKGDFDWYSAWEEWAKREWERQKGTYDYSQRQQTYGERREFEGKPSSRRARPKSEYQWEFDPDDPYSVLGIRRGATKAEVSAAFRKQMMAYHPDMVATASEAEKDRALERSKLITEAYRKIKAEMK